MEKKTVTKKEAVVSTIYKEIDVDVFIAEDGKEFAREKDCIAHEVQLEIIRKWNAIKKKSFYGELDDVDGEWFFAKDDEELELIKRNQWWYESSSSNRKSSKVRTDGEIVPQKWFCVRYEDGGDYADRVCYTSLDSLKDQWESFIENFKGENADDL